MRFRPHLRHLTKNLCLKNILNCSAESLAKQLFMFLLILGSACCGGCDNDTSTGSIHAPTPILAENDIPEVTTAEVKLWRSDIQQRFSGVLRPNRRALLSTRMSGTLTHMHVAAGDKVEAGELLAQVDARDIIATLDAAQAQLQAAQSAHAKAQLDVQRLQRLYAEDLIARNRLERAQVERNSRKAALEQARTQVRLHQTNLEYARISAPFDGIVSEVLIDEGSFVGPGTSIVILEDRSSFRIDVPISAHAANSLKTYNSRFLIKTLSMPRARVARYQDIIPSMQKGGVGQILRLHLEAADDRILPGQIARVVLKTTQPEQVPKGAYSGAPVTMIPRSALIQQGQLTSVMLITATEDDSNKNPPYRVVKRWIVTASTDISTQMTPTSENIIKVLQGLKAGERVVTNPDPDLSNGQVVNLSAEPD